MGVSKQAVGGYVYLLTMKIDIDPISQVIESLAHNHQFGVFMDAVRQLRDESVRTATSNEVIGNPSVCSAALGEVRALQGIIDLYEDRAGTSKTLD